MKYRDYTSFTPSTLGMSHAKIYNKEVSSLAPPDYSVLLARSVGIKYISLTDIAKYKNPSDSRIVISNWLSSYSTIDFLTAWETLYK